MTNPGIRSNTWGIRKDFPLAKMTANETDSSRHSIDPFFAVFSRWAPGHNRVLTAILAILLLIASTLHGAIPPISTYDSEARDWAKVRIPAVTNTVTDLEYTIATELLQWMKSRGIRSRVKRMGIYLGSGLQSCRKPLIADTGPLSVTDTDTLISFVDGDYTVNGLTGNTTTKVITTDIQLGSFGSGFNHHVAVYNRTSGALNAIFEIGVGSVAANNVTQIAVNYTGLGTYYQDSITDYCNVAEASGVGFYLGSATASNSAIIYKNGVSHCSFSAPGSEAPYGGVFIHGRNNNGVQDSFSNRQLCFYSIGLGMSPTVQQSYYLGVQNAQRRRGRAL